MAASVGLRPRDVRACYGVVAACRDAGADARIWHTHLLEALARLIDAQVAIGGNMRHLAPGRQPESLGTIRRGWSSREAERAWREYVDRIPVTRTPEFGRLARFKGPLITCLRDQLWDRAAWYRSATYNEFHRASGIDDYIISIAAARPLGIFNSVWLHRPVGAPAFTRREWYMVHLVHREVGALIGGVLASAAEPRPSALSPRLRETLDCLLDGDSEKQAAYRLGLTTPTVHEYVCALYRHFGVSSRGELMARFVGRARPGWESPGADE